MSITRQEALEYHQLNGKPGKISVEPTKPLQNQHHLSLAYTPGVAFPVLEIEKDPEMAYEYTSKGNLVAVISNGTAILGLGDRGPLASKPVMEGKGVLFKQFADIDVFDIEIDVHDPDQIVQVVAAIAPTFGGSTWKIFDRPNASSSSAPCKTCWTSPYSTTTSTAPQSFWELRCSTRSS
jgi:malate dehydrogenase (oxaloacetate-decarboxylating)(NADP+)